MSVDKFKFVSPGVFIDEIDESGIPSLPERMGPLVIGRFQKGPGLRPVKVESFKEFANLFGEPVPGNASGDIWRSGEMTAPTYAAYAVKAWLRNNSPCTVYRVLGEQASNAANTDDAKAGWITDADLGTTLSSAGGAYGLLVFPSASATTASASSVTGTLAAIWYLQEGAMTLTGAAATGSGARLVKLSGAGILVESETGQKFTANVLNGDGTINKTATFDFNRDSETFIRKVFNTDPTSTNDDIVGTPEKYWLGETFESNLRSAENSKLKTGDGLGATAVANTARLYGVIVGLGDGGGNVVWANHQISSRAAQTGYFISQDTRGSVSASFDPTAHTQDLFKFHALDSGEQANRDYKVSIVDIKEPTDNYNKYGSFTVQVRSAFDRDNSPMILEQYSNCSLDPSSPNYIARLIGDVHYTYDETNKRVREHGDNPNRSKILRVEVTDKVKNGGGEGLNPYGVKGPVVPKTQLLLSTTGSLNYAVTTGSVPDSVITTGHTAARLVFRGTQLTASIEWPTSRLRVSSSEGQGNQPTKAYYGYQSNIAGSKRYDGTNTDLHRGQPSGLDPTATPTSTTQYSWVFTLDDVEQAASDTTHSAWVSGSRARGNSWTAKSGSGYVLTGSGAGHKKFTSPMFGGFDGFDITEKDPLRNEYMSTSTEVANSSYYSLKKAIDIAADKDYIEFDLAAMPGITNDSLNSRLLTACEERADALAILDLEGGYKPPHENDSAETANIGSVEETVTGLKDLNLNSSYGCAFYPFVKIRDDVANSILYVPPSVVALGTMSSAQRKSAVWFAPAGFTRGGLSEGSAGLPVIGVRERLTSAQRDRLYDANINPIASFPSEGIVVFGQKTLQVTRSALDRINVRRLLIFLKKEISRIASRLLFDQNVQQTWDRFTGQVIPFLEGVQAGLGLTDFRVVLDDSTTTPDLVDRNVMYAKIFLKPARAIEFIALDFIITRSGASFDD